MSALAAQHARSVRWGGAAATPAGVWGKSSICKAADQPNSTQTLSHLFVLSKGQLTSEPFPVSDRLGEVFPSL